MTNPDASAKPVSFEEWWKAEDPKHWLTKEQSKVVFHARDNEIAALKAELERVKDGIYPTPGGFITWKSLAENFRLQINQAREEILLKDNNIVSLKASLTAAETRAQAAEKLVDAAKWLNDKSEGEFRPANSDTAHRYFQYLSMLKEYRARASDPAPSVDDRKDSIPDGPQSKVEWDLRAKLNAAEKVVEAAKTIQANLSWSYHEVIYRDGLYKALKVYDATLSKLKP